MKQNKYSKYQIIYFRMLKLEELFLYFGVKKQVQLVLDTLKSNIMALNNTFKQFNKNFLIKKFILLAGCSIINRKNC